MEADLYKGTCQEFGKVFTEDLASLEDIDDKIQHHAEALTNCLKLVQSNPQSLSVQKLWMSLIRSSLKFLLLIDYPPSSSSLKRFIETIKPWLIDGKFNGLCHKELLDMYNLAWKKPWSHPVLQGLLKGKDVTAEEMKNLFDNGLECIEYHMRSLYMSSMTAQLITFGRAALSHSQVGKIKSVQKLYQSYAKDIIKNEEDLFQLMDYFDFEVTVALLNESIQNKTPIHNFCNATVKYLLREKEMKYLDEILLCWIKILRNKHGTAKFFNYLSANVIESTALIDSVQQCVVLVRALWNVVAEPSRMMCVEILWHALQLLSSDQPDSDELKKGILSSIAYFLPNSQVSRSCVLTIFVFQPSLENYLNVAKTYKVPYDRDNDIAKDCKAHLRLNILEYLQKQWPFEFLQSDCWDWLRAVCRKMLSCEDLEVVEAEEREDLNSSTASSNACIDKDTSDSNNNSVSLSEFTTLHGERDKEDTVASPAQRSTSDNKQQKNKKTSEKKEATNEVTLTCPEEGCDRSYRFKIGMSKHLSKVHKWAMKEVHGFYANSSNTDSTSSNLVDVPIRKISTESNTERVDLKEKEFSIQVISADSLADIDSKLSDVVENIEFNRQSSPVSTTDSTKAKDVELNENNPFASSPLSNFLAFKDSSLTEPVEPTIVSSNLHQSDLHHMSSPPPANSSIPALPPIFSTFNSSEPSTPDITLPTYEESNIACPICPRSFKHRHTVQEHIEFRHKISPEKAAKMAQEAKPIDNDEVNSPIDFDAPLDNIECDIISARGWHSSTDAFIDQEFDQNPIPYISPPTSAIKAYLEFVVMFTLGRIPSSFVADEAEKLFLSNWAIVSEHHVDSTNPLALSPLPIDDNIDDSHIVDDPSVTNKEASHLKAKLTNRYNSSNVHYSNNRQNKYFLNNKATKLVGEHGSKSLKKKDADDPDLPKSTSTSQCQTYFHGKTRLGKSEHYHNLPAVRNQKLKKMKKDEHSISRTILSGVFHKNRTRTCASQCCQDEIKNIAWSNVADVSKKRRSSQDFFSQPLFCVSDQDHLSLPQPKAKRKSDVEPAIFRNPKPDVAVPSVSKPSFSDALNSDGYITPSTADKYKAKRKLSKSRENQASLNKRSCHPNVELPRNKKLKVKKSKDSLPLSSLTIKKHLIADVVVKRKSDDNMRQLFPSHDYEELLKHAKELNAVKPKPPKITKTLTSESTTNTTSATKPKVVSCPPLHTSSPLPVKNSNTSDSSPPIPLHSPDNDNAGKKKGQKPLSGKRRIDLRRLSSKSSLTNSHDPKVHEDNNNSAVPDDETSAIIKPCQENAAGSKIDIEPQDEASIPIPSTSSEVSCPVCSKQMSSAFALACHMRKRHKIRSKKVFIPGQPIDSSLDSSSSNCSSHSIQQKSKNVREPPEVTEACSETATFRLARDNPNASYLSSSSDDDDDNRHNVASRTYSADVSALTNSDRSEFAISSDEDLKQLTNAFASTLSPNVSFDQTKYKDISDNGDNISISLISDETSIPSIEKSNTDFNVQKPIRMKNKNEFYSNKSTNQSESVALNDVVVENNRVFCPVVDCSLSYVHVRNLKAHARKKHPHELKEVFSKIRNFQSDTNESVSKPRTSNQSHDLALNQDSIKILSKHSVVEKPLMVEPQHELTGAQGISRKSIISQMLLSLDSSNEKSNEPLLGTTRNQSFFDEVWSLPSLPEKDLFGKVLEKRSTSKPNDDNEVVKESLKAQPNQSNNVLAVINKPSSSEGLPIRDVHAAEAVPANNSVNETTSTKPKLGEQSLHAMTFKKGKYVCHIKNCSVKFQRYKQLKYHYREKHKRFYRKHPDLFRFPSRPHKASSTAASSEADTIERYYCPFEGCLSNYAYAKDLKRHSKLLHSRIMQAEELVDCTKVIHLKSQKTKITKNQSNSEVNNSRCLMVKSNKKFPIYHVKLVNGRCCCPKQSCSTTYSNVGNVRRHFIKTHFDTFVQDGKPFFTTASDPTANNATVLANETSPAELSQEAEAKTQNDSNQNNESKDKGARRNAYTEASLQIQLSSFKVTSRKLSSEQELMRIYNKRARLKVARALSPAKSKISKLSLLKRRSRVESNDSTDSFEADYEAQLPCWYCEAMFHCRRNLSLHIQHHLRVIDLALFRCDTPGCLYGFKTKEELDLHKLNHKKKSKHICLFCPNQSRAFISFRKLTAHEEEFHTNLQINMEHVRNTLCLNKSPVHLKDASKDDNSQLSEHFLADGHRRRSLTTSEGVCGACWSKHSYIREPSVAVLDNDHVIHEFVACVIDDVTEAVLDFEKLCANRERITAKKSNSFMNNKDLCPTAGVGALKKIGNTNQAISDIQYKIKGRGMIDKRNDEEKRINKIPIQKIEPTKKVLNQLNLDEITSAQNKQGSLVEKFPNQSYKDNVVNRHTSIESDQPSHNKNHVTDAFIPVSIDQIELKKINFQSKQLEIELEDFNKVSSKQFPPVQDIHNKGSCLFQDNSNEASSKLTLPSPHQPTGQFSSSSTVVACYDSQPPVSDQLFMPKVSQNDRHMLAQISSETSSFANEQHHNMEDGSIDDLMTSMEVIQVVHKLVCDVEVEEQVSFMRLCGFVPTGVMYFKQKDLLSSPGVALSVYGYNKEAFTLLEMAENPTQNTSSFSCAPPVYPGNPELPHCSSFGASPFLPPPTANVLDPLGSVQNNELQPLCNLFPGIFSDSTPPSSSLALDLFQASSSLSALPPLLGVTALHRLLHNKLNAAYLRQPITMWKLDPDESCSDICNIFALDPISRKLFCRHYVIPHHSLNLQPPPLTGICTPYPVTSDEARYSAFTSIGDVFDYQLVPAVQPSIQDTSNLILPSSDRSGLLFNQNRPSLYQDEAPPVQGNLQPSIPSGYDDAIPKVSEAMTLEGQNCGNLVLEEEDNKCNPSPGSETDQDLTSKSSASSELINDVSDNTPSHRDSTDSRLFDGLMEEIRYEKPKKNKKLYLNKPLFAIRGRPKKSFDKTRSDANKRRSLSQIVAFCDSSKSELNKKEKSIDLDRQFPSSNTVRDGSLDVDLNPIVKVTRAFELISDKKAVFSLDTRDDEIQPSLSKVHRSDDMTHASESKTTSFSQNINKSSRNKEPLSNEQLLVDRIDDKVTETKEKISETLEQKKVSVSQIMLDHSYAIPSTKMFENQPSPDQQVDVESCNDEHVEVADYCQEVSIDLTTGADPDSILDTPTSVYPQKTISNFIPTNIGYKPITPSIDVAPVSIGSIRRKELVLPQPPISNLHKDLPQNSSSVKQILRENSIPCLFCSLSFPSIEECKEHFIKIHMNTKKESKISLKGRTQTSKLVSNARKRLMKVTHLKQGKQNTNTKKTINKNKIASRVPPQNNEPHAVPIFSSSNTPLTVPIHSHLNSTSLAMPNFTPSSALPTKPIAIPIQLPGLHCGSNISSDRGKTLVLSQVNNQNSNNCSLQTMKNKLQLPSKTSVIPMHNSTNARVLSLPGNNYSALLNIQASNAPRSVKGKNVIVKDSKYTVSNQDSETVLYQIPISVSQAINNKMRVEVHRMKMSRSKAVLKQNMITKSLAIVAPFQNTVTSSTSAVLSDGEEAEGVYNMSSIPITTSTSVTQALSHVTSSFIANTVPSHQLPFESNSDSCTRSVSSASGNVLTTTCCTNVVVPVRGRFPFVDPTFINQPITTKSAYHLIMTQNSGNNATLSCLTSLPLQAKISTPSSQKAPQMTMKLTPIRVQRPISTPFTTSSKMSSPPVTINLSTNTSSCEHEATTNSSGRLNRAADLELVSSCIHSKLSISNDNTAVKRNCPLTEVQVKKARLNKDHSFSSDFTFVVSREGATRSLSALSCTSPSNLRLYQCRRCSSAYSNRFDYKMHMFLVHSLYLCSFKRCSAIFDNENQLEEHCRMEHGSIVRSIKNSNNQPFHVIRDGVSDEDDIMRGHLINDDTPDLVNTSQSDEYLCNSSQSEKENDLEMSADDEMLMCDPNDVWNAVVSRSLMRKWHTKLLTEMSSLQGREVLSLIHFEVRNLVKLCHIMKTKDGKWYMRCPIQSCLLYGITKQFLFNHILEEHQLSQIMVWIRSRDIAQRKKAIEARYRKMKKQITLRLLRKKFNLWCDAHRCVKRSRDYTSRHHMDGFEVNEDGSFTDPSYKCRFMGCGKTFGGRLNFSNHMITKHSPSRVAWYNERGRLLPLFKPVVVVSRSPTFNYTSILQGDSPLTFIEQDDTAENDVHAEIVIEQNTIDDDQLSNLSEQPLDCQESSPKTPLVILKKLSSSLN